MNMPKKCPQIECGKRKCCVDFRKIVIPAVLGDDSDSSEVKPQNGAYCNTLVEYEANGALYIYSSDGIPTKMYYTSDDLQGIPTINYVDSGDARTLSSSKSYTNTKFSDAVTDAEAYADSKDAETLAAAKAYADAHSGEGSVKQQYVDDHDAATLQAAKGYTDQQINILRSTVTNEINAALTDIPVITMTTTDPGEGQPLAPNHFIAVYQDGE